MSIDDLYQRPGFLLKRCHQVSAAIFLEECGAFNITPSQYGALRVLAEYPGLDQIALARLTGLDRSTVGLVIKLLQRRKLILRTPNPVDKRRMQISLSADGKCLLEEMRPAAARAQERVLAGLPAESRALFLALLNAFLAGHGGLIDPGEIVESALSAA